MKLTDKFKVLTKTLITSLAISAIIMSCSKHNEDPDQLSAMDVIHASPTTEKFDFYIGTTKVNQNDFGYTNKINYLAIYPGERTIKITKKGSEFNVLKETINLENQNYYSLFVIDQFEKVKFLLVKDIVTAPEDGKAKLRFMNLSPDAGALNLEIIGTDAPSFTSKLFTQYSNFESIEAGDNVTFKIKDIEGYEVAVLNSQKIEAGKAYTIWVKGLKSATTEEMKIGAVIYIHE